MEVNGQWVGWGLGDHSQRDFTVRDVKKYMRADFRSYAGNLVDNNIFDDQMRVAVVTMQSRLVANGKLTPGLFMLGVLDLPTEYAMGFRKKPLTLAFSAEGHQSDMFSGPIADTFKQMEAEQLCKWEPTNYDDNAIPFNNASGVTEMARRIGQTTQDNGVPFPAGTKFILGGFSQGMIVLLDLWRTMLQAGQPLNWRLKDLVAILAYGNPGRALNSAAPWALPLIKNVNTHGLDPVFRFGFNGIPDPRDMGIQMVDVWREGDIFAQNGDDLQSQMKAAIYQLIARGDAFSTPTSIAAQVFHMFLGQFSMGFILGIVEAIWSGITFGIKNPNPHYAPYDQSGGIDWTRKVLQAA